MTHANDEPVGRDARCVERLPSTTEWTDFPLGVRRGLEFTKESAACGKVATQIAVRLNLRFQSRNSHNQSALLVDRTSGLVADASAIRRSLHFTI